MIGGLVTLLNCCVNLDSSIADPANQVLETYVANEEYTLPFVEWRANLRFSVAPQNDCSGDIYSPSLNNCMVRSQRSY